MLAGTPIATITATNSDRIIGYLPANFPIEPHLGLPVLVRTRAVKRRTGRAQIIGVSPNLESITNALVAPLVLRNASLAPLGRVVSVSLPPGMPLRPGEPVDVTLLVK